MYRRKPQRSRRRNGGAVPTHPRWRVRSSNWLWLDVHRISLTRAGLGPKTGEFKGNEVQWDTDECVSCMVWRCCVAWYESQL